ncbi:hypothetical protein AB0I40_36690, partial [Nocardia salmonicida]
MFDHDLPIDHETRLNRSQPGELGPGDGDVVAVARLEPQLVIDIGDSPQAVMFHFIGPSLNYNIAWTTEHYGLAIEQMRRAGQRIDD